MSDFAIQALYIELLSRCNIHSPYCYNDSHNGKDNQLDYEAIKIVIDDANLRQVKSVFLSGGEPTLYNDILDLIQFIEKKNMNVCVITNCTNINEEFINMTKCDFQITLDGAKKETHGITRGCTNYSEILNIFRILKEKGMSHRVHLRYNVSMTNLTEISELMEIVEKFEIENIYFGAIISTGRGVMSYTKMGIYNNYQITNDTQALLSKLKNTYDNRINVSFPEPCLSFGCILYQDAPALSMKIDSQGYIYPCSLFTDKRYSIGNIYHDRLSDAVIFKRIEDIIEIAESKRLTDTDCKYCICQEVCKGGCIAIYLDHDCKKEHEDLCSIRKKSYNKIFEKIRLNAK